MNLPQPGPKYDPTNEARARLEVERVDAANHKKGQDIEVGLARVIIMDPLTGLRYALDVTGGTLSAVAV